jgi:polyphosphate kinase
VGGALPEVDVGGSLSRRYINRELSWLEFNHRVLAQAEDASLPLLERVKFVAICSNNLDEFFQVRVAGLKAQLDADVAPRSIDGLTAAEQLDRIATRARELVALQEEIFAKALAPELAEQGIRLETWDGLGAEERAGLSSLFAAQVLPVLTPLAIHPGLPFPPVSNLSLNLAVGIRDPETGTERLSHLGVPPLLPRFLELPGGRFLPLEQLVAAHLESLFPGLELRAADVFRVTLDARLSVDPSEAEDLLGAIRSGLHRRRRLNRAVRLELDASASARVRELLVRELALSAADVSACRCPLDLGSLWQLCGLDRPDLKQAAWAPVTQPRLAAPARRRGDPDAFGAIRGGDVLVHHPYESFHTSIEAFLTQAARDPDVLTIKHTLYRTSGPENPVVRALIAAAHAGKQVVALIELRARFDEESNIEWARSLVEAGVHVVYGLPALKTHAKIALVVRREGGALRRYCHVGTGNYNPETARVYEDVGLMTASEEIAADVGALFNHLTGWGRVRSYRKLLVAPEGLRPALLRLIRAESLAGDGRIAIKVNGVSDPELIDALYEASGAGVEIDLVVRGICCLRPGVPGLSERIRVRSILGRYLEHSRIFRFGSERRRYRYFIGSADLMTRNLEQRVEVVTPVEDAELQARLEEILQVNLSPGAVHWSLEPDGSWRLRNGEDRFSTQARLQALAQERAEGPVRPDRR